MQKSTSEPDVLAIDQGTHCGLVRGNGLTKPVVNSWVLPTNPDAVGETLFDLRIRLIKEVEKGPLLCIVFETPILGRHPNMQTSRKLLGIAGVIEAVCYEYKVRAMEMGAGTWKKAFTGRGDVSKKMRPYPPMVRCAQLGIKVDNMDEADAVGIWATYQASRGHHWLAGDLFQGLM